MNEIEGLGSFYLGKPYDVESKSKQDGYVLYDSEDLTTHAVCVGMTGSGKTGLCVGVIEEAALDGVPSIVIDPKGDLANLMLTFPALRPEDFRPWINEDDAAKAGVSPDDYAKSQAELWSKGLADWGQDGARIQRLRDAADFAIYTPGSDAGLPVSVLGSFAPPADRSDAEALRRPDRRHRDRPAGAARHRRRSDQEPRAHPALEHPRRGLGQRPVARHRRR